MRRCLALLRPVASGRARRGVRARAGRPRRRAARPDRDAARATGSALGLGGRPRCCGAPRSSTPTAAASSACSPAATARRAALRATRREIYLPETYYARGTRGERTDVVDDLRRAARSRPQAEVVIPPKRAEHTPWRRGTRRSPTTSASSRSSTRRRRRRSASSTSRAPLRRRDRDAGLQPRLRRRPAPLRHRSAATAPRSRVDARRARAARPAAARSEPFFDPQAIPLTEKAVRHGDQLVLRLVRGRRAPGRRLAATAPRFGEPWSLFDDADAPRTWRIGGMQHLALHARDAAGSTRSCTRAAPTRTRSPARRSGSTTSRTQRARAAHRAAQPGSAASCCARIATRARRRRWATGCSTALAAEPGRRAHRW